jgi:transposase
MDASTVARVASKSSGEVPGRRVYSAEYKNRVLDEIDRCRERGQVGEILRREGLYSSLIDAWRKQRARAGMAGLAGRKPGRKADPVARELVELRERVSELEDKLATANDLIEAQGKVSALLQDMSRKSAKPN